MRKIAVVLVVLLLVVSAVTAKKGGKKGGAGKKGGKGGETAAAVAEDSLIDPASHLYGSVLMPTGSDGLTPIVPNPFIPGEFVENPSPFGLVKDPRDPTKMVPAGPDHMTPMLPDPRFPGFLAPASIHTMMKNMASHGVLMQPFPWMQQPAAAAPAAAGAGANKGGKKGGKKGKKGAAEEQVALAYGGQVNAPPHLGDVMAQHYAMMQQQQQQIAAAAFWAHQQQMQQQMQGY